MNIRRRIEGALDDLRRALDGRVSRGAVARAVTRSAIESMVLMQNTRKEVLVIPEGRLAQLKGRIVQPSGDHTNIVSMGGWRREKA